MLSSTVLSRLDELERTYNGPIPPPYLEVARHGSGLLVALLHAAGRRGFYAEAVRSQIRIIRRRRAEGSLYPGLTADLALYRREFRRADRDHRELLRLVRGSAPMIL